jgi:hypothetical protein
VSKGNIAVSRKSERKSLNMVIANAVVKCEGEETDVSPYNKRYHAASERNVGQNEFRLAVETVLPRLLGHSKYKRKRNFEAEENACPKTYVDAVYDFGRWLGSVSNSFHRYWTRSKRVAEISLTSSRMKDFFILLGNCLHFIVSNIYLTYTLL